ncbi:MAG: molybdate ABC transporter substrate-binding protein [Burkholderiaceae bacterium]
MQCTVLKRALAAAALVAATGCAIAADLTVSAASSLTNAFKEIAQGYQAQYPGAKVALNFGGSGALLQQLAKGAPVDVFASADQETMDMAEQQRLVAAGDRHNFVRNALVLIAPADSQLAIRRLQDLRQPGIKRIAIGNPASVPVGRYTKHALEAAKLWSILEARVISTQSVRQSLDYVARGEVDAGFVYATDAAIMKEKVKAVLEVPLDIAIRYPIAKTIGSTNGEEAKRFVGYVLSPAGQTILHKYGFSKP